MAGSPFSYPGAGILEIHGNIGSIASAGETIAAFVGRALKGPLNQATTIHNFGEFDRQFGGLSYDSTMSYAVWHYFLNGGTTAVIVRIPSNYCRRGRTVMRCPDTSHSFDIQARSEGPWINYFLIIPTYTGINPSSTTDFNLVVQQHSGRMSGGLPNSPVLAQETHYNLSMDPNSPRFVATILERDSEWVRVYANSLATMPAVRPIPASMNFDWSTGEDSGILDDTSYLGDAALKTGIYALDGADYFDLLCIPPMKRGTAGGAGYDISTTVWSAALAYCKKRGAILLVDPPAQWTSVATAVGGIEGLNLRDENAALYFPRILAPDVNSNNQVDQFASCGAVAGIIARTDGTRGIWKAPAGLDARLNGIQSPVVNLTDAEVGQLNPIGVNVIRTKPSAGMVIWGSRTLKGADRLASDWKYLPVRRMALYLERSLYDGLQWVVFESNDASLWGEIRLSVGAFMQDLFRKGAFQGAKASEAYFVQCDSETTTQNDINQGVVNVIVGFAPLKPAEFVIIKLQQMAGQAQS